MRAAAIVLALPRRVDGASLFGKTLETVLAERPCRVVIESTPPADSTRAAPAGARAAAGGAVKALTRLTSFLLVFLGVGDHVPDGRRRRRRDGRSGSSSALLFVAAGAGPAVPARAAGDAREPLHRRG